MYGESGAPFTRMRSKSEDFDDEMLSTSQSVRGTIEWQYKRHNTSVRQEHNPAPLD